MDTFSAHTLRPRRRTRDTRSRLTVVSAATVDPRSITWRNVAAFDRATHGAIARLDPDAVEHFKFPQAYTLKRGVRMATTPTLTIALQTLARNVLAPLASTAWRAEWSNPDARLRVCARAFASDVLVAVAGADWRIPPDTVGEWLSSHAREE